MRRNGFLVVALGFALALTAAGCNDSTSGVTIFQAQLAGSNEVPARSTAASGAAGFNLKDGTFTYSIEVNGLTQIVGAHIHLAAAGVNGPIRVNFYTGTARPVSNGVILEGSFTAADITGGVTFEQLVAAMSTGGAYVNVHSPTFPGGEIRGQVQLVQTN